MFVQQGVVIYRDFHFGTSAFSEQESVRVRRAAGRPGVNVPESAKSRALTSEQDGVVVVLGAPDVEHSVILFGTQQNVILAAVVIELAADGA